MPDHSPEPWELTGNDVVKDSDGRAVAIIVQSTRVVPMASARVKANGLLVQGAPTMRSAFRTVDCLLRYAGCHIGGVEVGPIGSCEVDAPCSICRARKIVRETLDLVAGK